jgi:putative ABC transport system permease protein
VSGVNRWFHGWRAAVRIARRDAWRSKGRSALVLGMIALPIVGVSAMDITVRSSELSTAEQIRRSMGAADARLEDGYGGNQPIYQGIDDHDYAPVDPNARTSGPTDIRRAVPAGAHWLQDSTGDTTVRTRHGLLDTRIRELKAANPMAAGLMTLVRGSFPAKADEVAASTAFLKQSGLRVGSRVSASSFGTRYTITGAYELPDGLGAVQLNALPGTFLTPLSMALTREGRPAPDVDTSFLVDVDSPAGFTWNMVEQANTKGVYVDSRAVRLDPPPPSEVRLYIERPDWVRRSGTGTADQVILLGVVATVVGLAMLEICLLAGPAFAVGARRSRRQLGLVGANGGDRRHIRAVVLSGGLVIGAVAAVTGTAAGLGLTVALRPVLEEYVGKRFGGIEVRPLELLGIALLALLTGLAAAVVPAVTASRQSVLASLTGRRGVRRANRVLPVLGAAAVCLGGGLAVFGPALTDSVLVIGGGSAIAELGVVALTPTLVGLFGRLGRWLPLSPRLALRDAVRNRGRTAPAVAAVLAAVAGTVAVATYAASTDRQGRDTYQATLPHGAVAVTVPLSSSRHIEGIRTAVERSFPVTGRADVRRVVIGKKVCDEFQGGSGCGKVEVVTPKQNLCALWSGTAGKLSTAELRRWQRDWRCQENGTPSALDTESGVVVADAKLLEALRVKDPDAVRALEHGQAVSFDRRHVTGGKLTLALIEDYAAVDDTEKAADKAPHVTVAAYTAPSGTSAYGLDIVLPPAAAKAAGLRTVPFGSVFTDKRVPTSTERQELNGALEKLSVQADVRVEEGYVSKNSVTMLALAVFAGLVTIGAAGIATGLAQADAEPDLRTLAAVGASPRVRRTLSGFQCGMIAAMGVLLGSVSGVLPAVGLRLAERRNEEAVYREAFAKGWSPGVDLPHVPVVVPWPTLALLVVAVPLGAALLAALVTRSRTDLARRAEA